MKVVIPFKPSNPKSRLSSILSLEERVKLAKFMLLDVVDAVANFADRIVVLVPEGCNFSLDYAEVLEDSRSLDDAVNAQIEKDTAIIMSDLPLLNRSTLERFFNSDGDVVIAPGRKGGTNMLLIRDKRFRVSYHYGSFFKHLKIARKLGLKVEVFDSFYASLDIDDENDLLELLMHGKGKRSHDYLVSIGFSVDFSEKDPKLVRSKS
jgi:2-phospho-L-lactate guanylyltransferase